MRVCWSHKPLATAKNLPRDVFPPPKLQNVFVCKPTIIDIAMSCIGFVDEGHPHGVSTVSQAEQCFSVCLFVFGVGEGHRTSFTRALHGTEAKTTGVYPSSSAERAVPTTNTKPSIPMLLRRFDPHWYSKPKVTGATCVAMKRVAA